MITRLRMVCGLMVLSMAAGASGQLVTPVPPAAAPLPEYTPPAPPPPPPTSTAAAPAAPAAPAEPDLPPIDVVQRTTEGKVTLLAIPGEEAVVSAIIGHLTDDETKNKLRALIADRLAASEQAIARNAQVALESRAKLAMLDSISDTRAISGINADLRPAVVTPSLIDMAQQMRLLTPKQVKVARDAAKAYREAFTNEAREAAGGDPIKMIEPAMKVNVRINAVEPMRALDELLDRLSTRWTDVRGGIGLTDAQASEIAAAERALSSAGTPAAKRDALAGVLKLLSSQQQSAALMTIASPMPEGLPVSTAPAGAARPRPAGGKTPGKE
ncbi:MAG: hypothetical protein AB7K52_05765 [Phycisphaerales bacterium]